MKTSKSPPGPRYLFSAGQCLLMMHEVCDLRGRVDQLYRYLVTCTHAQWAFGVMAPLHFDDIERKWWSRRNRFDKGAYLSSGFHLQQLGLI